MQRDPRAAGVEFAPTLFFGHDFQAEHLAVIFAHLFHLPGKQNHAREFHPVSFYFKISFAANWRPHFHSPRAPSSLPPSFFQFHRPSAAGVASTKYIPSE